MVHLKFKSTSGTIEENIKYIEFLYILLYIYRKHKIYKMKHKTKRNKD